jgi:hypothetical protein
MHPMPKELLFPLDAEDGWPPVSIEALPVKERDHGFAILSAPLFITNISVDDVIAPICDDEGIVRRWSHIERSNHSTIWLLRLRQTNEIENCLTNLRALGCDTVGLTDIGCYAVDVPSGVPISEVDRFLNNLDEDHVAVAFPSMRHPE